ncbi:HlyD family efflux transporter periplasmic adaptor subunit [Alkalinema sp. FACHB-956]|uniref:efflux RND transporter periplasmic adaptor subunit n=1 Tax=Alkalinema sp. FACHB-956 TaxID=2692768 RepID=UPI001688EA6D|nr:HlyD family efflux transporter periplasmic adaptor subunit [Alkalinema sp. FACHB-956]MBD2329186.1 HlyD family efflux transporter periplasmic adaptor subunit [Alkalinema sp. FACHB-956]
MIRLPKPQPPLPDQQATPPAAQPLGKAPKHQPPPWPWPPPKHWLKGLLWGTVGTIGVGIIANALKPVPVVVQVATVQRGDLQVTVNAEGKTRIHDRFVVAAPVSGRLQRVALDVGDRVAAGAVIAKLDPLSLATSVQQIQSQLQEWKAQRDGVKTQRPKAAAIAQAQAQIQAAQAKQQQAQARVNQAQAQLDQMTRDWQRDRALAAIGAIPQKSLESSQLAMITQQRELEAAQLAVAAASSEIKMTQAALGILQQEQSDPDYLLQVYDAKIASAEAELYRLQEDAAQTIVRSPITGQVLSIDRKSAQFVAEGTPIVSLGDISKLELVIDTLSSDAEKVKPGHVILVTQGNQPPIRASVQQVEPMAFTKVSALGIEEQRVNVIGQFSNPPKTLGDGYRVDVKIVIWEGRDRLQVPLSALFRCQKNLADWCLFKVDGGKAQQQPVQIGQRNHLMAEVKQGLQLGDTVILHPTDSVKHGVLVQADMAK